MKIKVLSIDPGESSGWLYAELDTLTNEETNVQGGTVKHDRPEIWRLLHSFAPDILLLEEFKLYATHAKALTHSTFYTCEIIGLIKLYVDLVRHFPRVPEHVYDTKPSFQDVRLFTNPALNKKYSGADKSDVLWQTLLALPKVTEHTYDAYQHYAYFKRHRLQKFAPVVAEKASLLDEVGFTSDHYSGKTRPN